MNTAATAILALLFVLALAVGTFWLIRRFGSAHMGQSRGGRQPRLAVIDESGVDGRRKLVLVRRDNVEHLLLIGGPTDIVVEPNIVRAQPARDAGTGRGPALPDSLPRTNNGAEQTQWPLAPDVPQRAPRPAAADETQWSTPPEPQPRRTRQLDTLAGLAAELSVQPEPTPPAAPRSRVAPPIDAPRVPAPAPAKPAEMPGANADQNLADMAHRLEAALRRPGASGAPKAPPPDLRMPLPAGKEPSAPRPAPAMRVEPKLEPHTEPKAEPKVESRAEPKLESAGENRTDSDKESVKNVFGSLEQEMASLLGRQGKT